VTAQTVEINWDDYNTGLRVIDDVWRKMERHALDGTLSDERIGVIEREFIDALAPLTLPQHFSDGTRFLLMMYRGNEEMKADLAEQARARGADTPAERDIREMAKRLY
jgi:hypothetical protein